jgi:sterol desaturase/sphingolipid hydroxylase (fatty acid hydroxylase superfamily)
LDLPPGSFYFLHRLADVFVSPGSNFSLASLACALFIAVVFLTLKRRRRAGRMRPKLMIRALFPRGVLSSPSSLIDIGYLGFHVFLFSILFGWAVLSFAFLSNAVIDLLAAAFGPARPSPFPEFVSRSLITVMLFLAYELGYWINHYLSHRVPFMWEFHKVHHSATVLTPLTNFRVHPGYMLIFANILAITTAIANGLGNYIFGAAAHQYALSNTNIILVFFIYVYAHLQHTHLWIPFRGMLGRLFMSPAHHQIHHSSNPIHFNKNLGSCLAVWDWMFGTLYVPGRARERLTFGVEPDRPDAHTISGEFLVPIWRAAAQLVPKAMIARIRNVGAPAPAGADPAQARIAVRGSFEIPER